MRKRSRFLGIIALIIVAIVIAGQARKKDVSVVRSETTEDILMVYPYDEKINLYLKNYNGANPGDQITGDIVKPYYHHGSEHKDQVKYTRDDFEVVITNGYPFEVVIRGASNKTFDENKKVFCEYAKGFSPSLTEKTLDTYWNCLIDNSTHDEEFDEFECYITMSIDQDRIEMIVVKGNI